jgi:hypothetical protein
VSQHHFRQVLARLLQEGVIVGAEVVAVQQEVLLSHLVKHQVYSVDLDLEVGAEEVDQFLKPVNRVGESRELIPDLGVEFDVELILLAHLNKALFIQRLGNGLSGESLLEVGVEGGADGVYFNDGLVVLLDVLLDNDSVVEQVLELRQLEHLLESGLVSDDQQVVRVTDDARYPRLHDHRELHLRYPLSHLLSERTRLN